MSSGFPGGHPDYFNINIGTNNVSGRSMSMMNMTNNPQGSYRSPLAGILADPSSQIGLRRPELMGKRSLAEFQHHHQLQQQAAFFLRNVKQRPYNQHASPVSPLSLVDFPNSPEVSSVSNMSSSSLSSVPRYGVPVMQQVHPASVQSFNLGNGNFNGVMGNYQHNNRGNFPRVSLPNLAAKQSAASQETEGKMMKRLQELEKQLLLDDEDGENDVSGVTNSEWSETIHNILGSTPVVKAENTVSPSPTSSSSSSCASSSASPATPICPKQLLSDTAVAIADGKNDSAMEILTRLNQVSNALGTPEQRLSFYIASALRSRLSGNPTTASELYGKDHIVSTQLLYDKSPCFKLALMAANDAILELGQAENSIHVVDFDIGQGVQYVYLLHEIAAARKVDKETNISLKLTTFTDFGNGGADRLKLVGDGLSSLSNKLGVPFSFNISTLKLSDLNASALMVEPREVLVVNFAFKLYKLPDESVTTENLRDEVLRRVKGLSPALVTVVEQDLNANTASFETRVSQSCGYYGALLESLDATIGRDNSERVKIEEGLSRKMMNSVACEGRDRVERCEVFGKWRARMSMAGFEPKAMSQLRAETLVSKVNSGTRGHPGFTVKEEAGGINFGWMGRSLTVASAWH
ncbi:scarecrow-like protein 8 [Lactuca sativa]|uniref:Scarecrow-like protein 8 n=1 Tax=Lactuca sativa TaxID=4236 RepID=A0A9R1WZ56_LACSA|nr:scarecrow-like protein 8 [Lactuca sativa]KAJ0190592.1 hypothetical protein LSAT_V11C800391600 [Lactuca sativa]